jgi:uncharacterized membrane protein
MKKNMGTADRVIRILVAVIIALLFYSNIITGLFAIVALILAAVFVATSFISFCPLYGLFGISTTPKKKDA